MDKMWNSLIQKIRKVLLSCDELCCPDDNGNYNVYGMDVELLDNLDPIIIEINSNPSRDYGWKAEFIKNILLDVKKGIFNKPEWIKIL